MSKTYYQYPKTKLNFKKTNIDLAQNTLTFENCSTMERYKEKSFKHYGDTLTNLLYHRNIILEKYGDFLRATSSSVYITSTEIMNDYNLNPHLVSQVELGSSEYWWLILYVNECLSINDFKDFKHEIKIPNIQLLIKRIKYDLAYNPNFGILIDQD